MKNKDINRLIIELNKESLPEYKIINFWDADIPQAAARILSCGILIDYFP
ncbi:hypothetical protein QWZ06_27520 [Chryseobacterium tructae]|uniref:Uncharacterized protein n=1 Tax=Chryseobacterium tructae TaxID=1037380 RepID=A0ABV7XR54_9FLAO|nr:hypothetical protein [Chryseobacterium tructae]MDN3695712.1 hypothetical protein [Chryseobacterium tructae]